MTASNPKLLPLVSRSAESRRLSRPLADLGWGRTALCKPVCVKRERDMRGEHSLCVMFGYFLLVSLEKLPSVESTRTTSKSGVLVQSEQLSLHAFVFKAPEGSDRGERVVCIDASG